MDTEMEDIHNNIGLSFHKGSKWYEMAEEGLEEGELIEGRPQIPNFKAFKLATFEAKGKIDRLSKVEVWEESMKRETPRKQCMGSVEGAASTRNVQAAELPLVSSTPSPSPQDSVYYDTRQGSVGSEISGWTEEEREQAIRNGMYGDAYEDIYGDVYWDTNGDTHEENRVSESLSRTRRKKSNRSKQRKKAAELQASLQIYGLLPVPLPPQPLQEQFDRTVSQRDSAALRPKPNNNQQEVRDQEVDREMTMEQSDSGGLTLQQDRLKKIADLRKRIMTRKALLQAQGLLPVPPSRQNFKENSIRILPDGNPEANIFQPHNIQEVENRQKSLEIMEIENLGSGASPQKKDTSHHFTKSPKAYRVRLREQRDKMRAQTQQSALDRQKLYGMAASPPQPTQKSPTVICKNHENDTATPLQQEKDTTVEKERETSTSIPNEIRVLLQREKGRRQRLSKVDNVELVEKRKEEQEQELSIPERTRLPIKNTKPRSVPAKICDVSEKISLESVKKQAALPDQDSSLHAHSTPPKPWQGENLEMEIDTVIEHKDLEEVEGPFSIPQNIGDMLDNSRRYGTKIGEVIQETSLRSDAIVEDASKDNWPMDIPDMLSQLLFLSEELGEFMKMENEWFGWLGMDTDIDIDIEYFINVTTPSSHLTIEHPSEPGNMTSRTTSDILSELFTMPENIENMMNTENEWFGWLGMHVDVEDFVDGL